ncbi:MAG TPA: hypothetical protein VM187_09310, partial [Niastella sp.]|nr:hypothetical protein [Niastella sp.]
ENGATTVFNLTYDGTQLKSFTSADGLEYTSLTLDGSGNVTKMDIRDHNDYITYTYAYTNGVPVTGTVKTVHKIGGEPDDVTQDDVLTYTVVNNQVTKIKKQMKVIDSEETVTLSYNSAGNLEKVILDGEEAFNVLFTWGTKKPGFPTMSKWVLDVGYSLQFFAKNEMLKAFYDFPGTQFDYELETNYTYDNDGYPLTSDDGETKLKFEY